MPVTALGPPRRARGERADGARKREGRHRSVGGSIINETRESAFRSRSFSFPLNVRSVNAGLKYDVYARRGAKEREVRKLPAARLLDHDAARNKAPSANDPPRERSTRARVRVRPR